MHKRACITKKASLDPHQGAHDTQTFTKATTNAYSTSVQTRSVYMQDLKNNKECPSQCQLHREDSFPSIAEPTPHTLQVSIPGDGLSSLRDFSFSDDHFQDEIALWEQFSTRETRNPACRGVGHPSPTVNFFPPSLWSAHTRQGKAMCHSGDRIPCSPAPHNKGPASPLSEGKKYRSRGGPKTGNQKFKRTSKYLWSRASTWSSKGTTEWSRDISRKVAVMAEEREEQNYARI